MFLGLLAPLMLLFAGFFIPRDQIPGWWIWTYWISFLQYALLLLLLFWMYCPVSYCYFSYAVEATTLNSLSGLSFFCEPDQFVQVPLANGETAPYLYYYCFYFCCLNHFNSWKILSTHYIWRRCWIVWSAPLVEVDWRGNIVWNLFHLCFHHLLCFGQGQAR